jgi:hypothetical protein
MTGWLTSRAAVFALGVVAASALRAYGPALGRLLRPVVKETIKGGLVAGRELQTLADEVREELEDVAAEARAEVEPRADRPGA